MDMLHDFLRRAAKNGEVRSGIILGIRMAMAGLRELRIANPGALRRSLVTIVETDRCLPDAVELVTGCRLGNRTLKFKDFGKMAATFVDLRTAHAVRLAAKESANVAALDLFPYLDRERALQNAYLELSQEDLFSCQAVHVILAEQDIPGYRSARAICGMCGEGVSFGKQVRRKGYELCRSCAGPLNFHPVDEVAPAQTLRSGTCGRRVCQSCANGAWRVVADSSPVAECGREYDDHKRRPRGVHRQVGNLPSFQGGKRAAAT